MAAIKPIRTERDYDDALARIEQIFQGRGGHPRGATRETSLVDLVELYEQRHHPIDPPSAIAAIEHEMDQRGLSRRDLIPLIGGSAKVSEVLSGKRDITIDDGPCSSSAPRYPGRRPTAKVRGECRRRPLRTRPTQVPA